MWTHTCNQAGEETGGAAADLPSPVGGTSLWTAAGVFVSGDGPEPAAQAETVEQSESKNDSQTG